MQFTEVRYIETPIGNMRYVITNTQLISLDFVEHEFILADGANPSIYARNVEKQLNEYFDGSRKVFDLPITFQGTPFQIASWRYLQSIPYAQTRCYSEEAEGIGRATAVRAVANANHNNRIPIIIPCHRVIGKDGTLTGYGGGLWRKKWLLEHEVQYA